MHPRARVLGPKIDELVRASNVIQPVFLEVIRPSVETKGRECHSELPILQVEVPPRALQFVFVVSDICVVAVRSERRYLGGKEVTSSNRLHSPLVIFVFVFATLLDTFSHLLHQEQ